MKIFWKNIPIPIQIFAVLHYAIAALFLILIFFILFPSLIFFDSALSALPKGFGIFFAFVYIISALIQILIARALLKGKRWIKSLYIFFGITGTFFGVLGILLLQFYSFERIMGVAFSAIIAYYFIFDKKAKTFFSINPVPLPGNPENKQGS